MDNDKKKKPKALIIASVASMIEQFNMHNIQLLLDEGYDVDVACNCKIGNTISDEQVHKLIRKLMSKDVRIMHVPIPRKVSDVKEIRSSIKLLKGLMEKNNYSLMHCHSPIGGVVARAAAIKYRKKGLKVIYTAHGFHFYKGAPKKNWLFFYPVEKIFSRYTDVLITINQEDYKFAKKNMKAGTVVYIPGVGIDTDKFVLENFDRDGKRDKLGINNGEYMVISVGELNNNKNHETAIRAIAEINNSHIHYCIAGIGDKYKYLEELAKQLGVNLHLLGYRTDIVELLNAADLFVFPSYREGLSVALMEAMAAGLPCVASKIRGNIDLVEEEKGGNLCEPTDIKKFAIAIENIINDDDKKMAFSRFNQVKIKKFDIKRVLDEMQKVYF